MYPVTPILLTAVPSLNLLPMLIPFFLAVAVTSLAFFIMKAIHKKKHPDEEDIKETNRQRREREKLAKETTEKVNRAMAGKKAGEEKAPNGKRCGKYKKKNKKK